MPNHHAAEVSSFSVTVQLSFTLNRVATHSDLGVINLTQPAKALPNCMACLPNCSVCSDIYVCDTCSSGSLIGGLCITNTLSPLTGDASQTPFSFDTSEFATISSHLNAQLGVLSSTTQVSVSYLRLTYPDLSLVLVTEPSSFIVPEYQVEGASDFTVAV